MPVSKHTRKGTFRRHTAGTFGAKVNGKPTGPRRKSKWQWLVSRVGLTQAKKMAGLK